MKMIMNTSDIPYSLVMEKASEAKELEQRIFQTQQMRRSHDMSRKSIIFGNRPSHLSSKIK